MALGTVCCSHEEVRDCVLKDDKFMASLSSEVDQQGKVDGRDALRGAAAGSARDLDRQARQAEGELHALLVAGPASGLEARDASASTAPAPAPAAGYVGTLASSAASASMSGAPAPAVGYAGALSGSAASASMSEVLAPAAGYAGAQSGSAASASMNGAGAPAPAPAPMPAPAPAQARIPAPAPAPAGTTARHGQAESSNKAALEMFNGLEEVAPVSTGVGGAMDPIQGAGTGFSSNLLDFIEGDQDDEKVWDPQVEFD